MKVALGASTIVPALLLVSVASASAESRVSLGLRGGINFAGASVSTDSPLFTIGASGESRFLAGITSEFSVGPVEMELDATYTQKGANLTVRATGASAPKLTTRLDYLEVHLRALRVTLGSSQLKLQPYLFAGPTLGFRLSAKADTPDGTRDIKDSTKSTEWTIEAGAGLKYRVSPKTSFTTEVCYAYGLTNILKDTEGLRSYKSRDVKVSAGILFRL